MSSAQLRIASTQKQTVFLTVPEVAELLRVKERTVYTWVSKRIIPYRKAGRFTLFDRDEILRWTVPEHKH